MKFSLSKETLIEALQHVQSVVATRSTMPILSNVLLVAETGRLTLTTTDGDLRVEQSISADVSQPGATTLPARRFFSIIRELPATDLSFESDRKSIATIKSGTCVFKVMGLPESEYPRQAEFSESNTFVIPQLALKDALKKTSYAISTDETRYVLNGILASFHESQLTIVATDGRRLAKADVELEKPGTSEVSLILPSKAVAELQRLLKEEGDVKIRTSPQMVSFELGTAVLTCKLIEGNYPNYRQVIPSETKERVTLERETFLTSVRRVSLLTTEKSSSVKLMFTQNNLDIVAQSPEIGEARESLPVKYTGKDISIAFNPEFLMAPLKNLSNDEVYLEMSDEMSPGVLKINTPFLYVLMPMRVSY